MLQWARSSETCAHERPGSWHETNRRGGQWKQGFPISIMWTLKFKFSLKCYFIYRLKSGGLTDMIAHSIDNGLLTGHLQVRQLKRGKFINLDQTLNCGKATTISSVMSMKSSWTIMKCSTNFSSVRLWWSIESCTCDSISKPLQHSSNMGSAWWRKCLR